MTHDALADVRDKRPLRRPDAAVDLTPEEAFLLSQADGHLTVGELQHVLPFPPETLARLLLALLAKGALEWVSGTARGPRIQPRRPAGPVADAGPAAVPPPTPVASEEDPEITRLRRRMRVTRRLLDQNDPFELFGVKPGAEDAEVREAFQRLTRQFHPDRYYALQLDGGLKLELEEIYGDIQNQYSFIATREARRARQKKTLGEPTPPAKVEGVADAGRLAELADEALARRQYPSAINNLRLADRMDPAGGWGQRAKLVELLEKVDRRVEVYNSGEESPHEMDITQISSTIAKIRDILPPVPRLLRDLAVFLYLHGIDFSLTRDMVQRLLREHRSVDNLLLAARVHLKGGMAGTALDLLEEVRSAVPDHPDLKQLLKEAKRRA